MTSPIPLRERLAAARYDEDLIFIDDALTAVQEWLREQAAGMWHGAEQVRDLADAIDKELNQ